MGGVGEVKFYPDQKKRGGGGGQFYPWLKKRGGTHSFEEVLKPELAVLSILMVINTRGIYRISEGGGGWWDGGGGKGE